MYLWKDTAPGKKRLESKTIQESNLLYLRVFEHELNVNI